MPKTPTILLTLTVLAGLSGAAGAQTPAPLPPPGEWVHATSLIEAPRYKPGFANFDYVNAKAPKGGTARLSGGGQTFDTLNPILDKGVQADGLGLIYETLMTPALDEFDIASQYGQIAEAVRFPADYSYVTYRLNPKAKWQDGQPVTADDVVWSFEKTVALDASRAFYYKHVVKAEKSGEREVTFTFDEKGNRELPHIVGELNILPKHWWEGTDANGKKRDIAASTLEPTMGSGPYKMGQVVAGRSIAYDRVPDYWGADLNVNVGQNNFDHVRYEYYRDLTVEFEAFKSDEFDFWSENEAKRWETGYDFPAIKANRVKKELVQLGKVSGVMVGFIPNLRRPLFRDVRVRQAFNYAFDFEDLNRTIFFGQYERINSFFYGIPLAWSGLPQGKELELLNTVKDKVPPQVFTEEYKNPVGGDPQKSRDNLRKALELMQAAGYKLQGNKLVGADGKPVTVELLLNGPTIERVALPYVAALAKIGITVTLRTVDPSQYVARVRSRDFDMMYGGWGQTNSPGNEQLDYWGSAAADRDSSRNYAGIKDPAVNALINQVIFNKDRDGQVAAVHALDRVLMWNQYVIPSYTILKERIAYWDRFGHPDPYPRFALGFPTVWWWDADKAAKTGGSK
ncbi:extracellular solute-binding protein [soil metagenome]